MRILPLVLGAIILLFLVVVTSTFSLLTDVFHSDGTFLVSYLSGVFSSVWFVAIFAIGAFLIFTGKTSSKHK